MPGGSSGFNAEMMFVKGEGAERKIWRKSQATIQLQDRIFQEKRKYSSQYHHWENVTQSMKFCLTVLGSSPWGVWPWRLGTNRLRMQQRTHRESITWQHELWLEQLSYFHFLWIWGIYIHFLKPSSLSELSTFYKKGNQQYFYLMLFGVIHGI